MTRRAGLTPMAHFVLRASDGDAPLPELADAWLRAGKQQSRLDQALPALARALADLVADGLVEVRRFRTWPAGWDGGALVDGDRLDADTRHPGTWLPGPARDGLLVARLTARGREHR
ncbi:hypothetical protein V6U81_16335 [Micromonospora sp. CPCC 205711]|uniref:hypothetical protein n=1 Tax=Micromonospora sp. CPCC 205547 TaxID=3122400 RepID=UPI002FF10926